MILAVAVEVVGLEGIADPAGMTIERALPALGFAGVTGVGVGKLLRFHLEAPDEATGREMVQAMCDRLLANPVIERATIHIAPADAAPPPAAPPPAGSAPS